MNHLTFLSAFLVLYMSLWFVVSLVKKRNDVADVAWGLGFVLMTWVSFMLADGITVRGVVVSLLVSVWGLRLAWHIHRRNKGRVEDYRYRAWRSAWGKWFYVRSYLQVYLLQGALLFLIVAPVLLINQSSDTSFRVLDFLGVCVWLVGFYFEAVGDAQLARFLNDPSHKGALMQEGLWSLTRHPNYFGEVVQWWGIWLMALSVPFGWLSVIGPITISFLILKVSGIPLLEKKMEQHPEFEAYKQKTRAFIPFPKRSKL